MLSLKPLQSPSSTCPNCQHKNSGFAKYLFHGAQVLGSGICHNCGTSYHHNWPVGHSARFPIAFTDNGVTSYDNQAALWLAEPLIRAVKMKLREDATIHRIVKKKTRRGIILNCLDPCFGHIIWKLFNASGYQDLEPEHGLMVLIPKSCIWMVPEYVAEIWAVDLEVKKMDSEIGSLHQFVQERCHEFDTLQLAAVNTHIDHQRLALSQFFKTAPFPIERFDKEPPGVVFIWREDRFWLRSQWEEWMWMACVKYSWSWLKPWFLYRQKASYERVISRVERILPGAIFKVAGLGSWGSFPPQVEDLRRISPDTSWEHKWCSAYAQSQLVIGVHGSSMLIPTALSAGFVELLPRYKVPFTTEDILLKHPPRYQTFLGRHLDLYTSPRLVAEHIVSIFKRFPYLQENTEATL